MIINLADWFKRKKKKNQKNELKDLPKVINNEKLMIESLLNTLRELDEKLSRHTDMPPDDNKSTDC